MKQKKYFILAAAAILMAACSENDLVEKQEPQIVEQEVNFDAYLNRGVTRAGATGELVTAPTTGKADLQTTGFGVFGYYTNNELYSESSKPNFFYNQKVSGATWTYSPIKYWPNEYGTAAISDAQDKLTFFAYAPWVEVEPTTGLLKDQSNGKNSSGIVALTRNTASGDPFVKYFVDMKPANRVDLCWGVAAEAFTSSVEGSLNNIAIGKTYKDVSKPAVTSKIKFDFNHALASLNVQIDADIDQDAHGGNPLATETKIFVRSVTFEGFASKGMFNLNAEKTAPKWYDLTGINELTNGKVTIYDGRRDGSEGQVNAEASNETPKDLNPVIVQSYTSTSGEFSGTTGVPSNTDPVNLFNSSTLGEPVYVIPTGEPLKVTIVYDVETKDDNLAAYLSDGKTKGSSVENSITKSITISSGTGTIGDALKLEAGKKYTVKLHLGMTSVKFEASVTDWANGDEGEPWLPKNSGSLTTFTPSASAISPSATTQVVTIGGEDFSTGYTATAKKNGNTFTNPTIDGTNFKLTIDATDFNDNTYVVTITKTATGEEQTVTINQPAAVITIDPSNISYDGTDIDLTSALSIDPAITPAWSTASVSIKDSGDNLVAGTYNNNGKFTPTGSLAHDTYTIIVEMGDATDTQNYTY